jgi:N-glycosylase/DNA lyase
MVSSFKRGREQEMEKHRCGILSALLKSSQRTHHHIHADVKFAEPRSKAHPAMPKWTVLCADASELCLRHTLTNGQCFNWAATHATDEYVGVLGRRVVLLRQRDGETAFRVASGGDASGILEELRDYFQLGTPLAPLVERWSAGDKRLATIAKLLPGMRVLRQPPEECLFSFICSSNNNIPRIVQMLSALRTNYGEPLDYRLHTGEPLQQTFTFPSAKVLAQVTEAQLRALGLGYRAKYIRETAKVLVAHGDGGGGGGGGGGAGPGWLEQLRTADSATVRTSLLTLAGVGPKVADCVALFSLDQAAVVPVDTHVWQIACRDYDASLREVKSLTPTVYDRVGACFASRFGLHAGWAHCLLFAAELPAFSVLLPEVMQREMAEHRALEKVAKANKTAAARQRKEARAATASDAGEQPPACEQSPSKKARRSSSSATPPRKPKGDEARAAACAPTPPAHEVAVAAPKSELSLSLSRSRFRIPLKRK